MSKVLNSFLTRILIATEATQGTPITGTNFSYVWPSSESDGLTPGEEPFDEVAIRGARGQLSTGFRQLQCLPGGNLGAAPIQLLPESAMALSILMSHFQKVTIAGTAAPYTYTFGPQTVGIEDGTFHTLTVLKDTGITDKCQEYAGCIADSIEFSWERGGVMKWTPEFKAMSVSSVATTPTNTISLGTGGFLQAPNIAVTFNGTAIYPTGFTFNSMNNSADRQSGSARGRVGHLLGDYSGEITLSTFRDDDFYDHFVAPFNANTVGTLVITATMDTSYGTTTGTEAITVVITALVRIAESPELAVTTGEMVETVNFKVVADTLPTVSITQATGALVS